jgi:hypothetical protein
MISKFDEKKIKQTLRYYLTLRSVAPNGQPDYNKFNWGEIANEWWKWTK